jgi:hypothetical protein
LALDFTLGFLGLWDNTHFSRFSTGALLGAVAVFYVMPGLVELSFRAGRFLSRNAVGEGAKEIVAEGFSERLSVAPSDYSAPHR